MIPVVIHYSRGYVVEGSRIRTHFEHFGWICALPESARAGHDVLLRHAQKTACQMVGAALDAMRQDTLANAVFRMKKSEIVAQAQSTPSGRVFLVVALPLIAPSSEGPEEDEKNTAGLPEKVGKALTAVFGGAVVRLVGLNDEPGAPELGHDWRVCLLSRGRSAGSKPENPSTEGPLPAALAYFESLEIGRAISGNGKACVETSVFEKNENGEGAGGEAGKSAGKAPQKRAARSL